MEIQLLSPCPIFFPEHFDYSTDVQISWETCYNDYCKLSDFGSAEVYAEC